MLLKAANHLVRIHVALISSNFAHFHAFAVPNFEELSKGITDVVYRAFFKNFCERCSKLYASDVPPIVTNVLLPRLRADSVILRAAALRWPRFAMAEAKAQRMRRFCAGGIEKERENCKKFLLDIGSKAFSPSCQVILDHIWDQAVPLDFVAVCQGISPVEPADAALARDIIESAKSIQAQAENAAAAGPCDDGDDAPEPASSSKRGSFGGCDISCSDDHYGMACDVCGVDYGWHQGKCSFCGCCVRHARAQMQPVVFRSHLRSSWWINAAVTVLQVTGACPFHNTLESQHQSLLSGVLFKAAPPIAQRDTNAPAVTSVMCRGSCIRVRTADMDATTDTKELHSKVAAQIARRLTKESLATSATDRGKCTCAVTIARTMQSTVRVVCERVAKCFVLSRLFREMPCRACLITQFVLQISPSIFAGSSAEFWSDRPRGPATNRRELLYLAICCRFVFCTGGCSFIRIA